MLYLRFWAHIVVAYAFTFWTCYILSKEYEKVAAMRLQFLASEKRRPDQYTVNLIFLHFNKELFFIVAYFGSVFVYHTHFFLVWAAEIEMK